MPPKTPALPSLQSIRANSEQSAPPTPRPKSTLTLLQRIETDRTKTLAFISEEVRARFNIEKIEYSQDVKNLTDTHEAIKKLLPRVFNKTTNDPKHWSKDTLHSHYRNAIIKGDWLDFTMLLRQAREIGTATQYSPDYNNNDLLITALQLAVARNDSTRNQFVTELLSDPQVRSLLNQNKTNYCRILSILFTARETALIVKLKDEIKKSTTKPAFKILFNLFQITIDETTKRAKLESSTMFFLDEIRHREAFILEEKNQFKNILDLAQTEMPTAGKLTRINQVSEIVSQAKTATLAVKNIDEINPLCLTAAETLMTLVTEENNQFSELLSQAQTSAFIAKKTDDFNTLCLTATENLNTLVTEEKNQFDDLISQTEYTNSSEQLASCRIKLNTLNKLCKKYMDYATERLGCDTSKGEPKISRNDSTKRRLLINKYECVKTLYNITIKTSSNASSLLTEFKNELSKSETQTLLQTQRDIMFIQLIISLWEIIKLIPNALRRSPSQIPTPGFWQPAKGKVLNDSLKEELYSAF